jgi:hypothetical protein
MEGVEETETTVGSVLLQWAGIRRYCIYSNKEFGYRGKLGSRDGKLLAEASPAKALAKLYYF